MKYEVGQRVKVVKDKYFHASGDQWVGMAGAVEFIRKMHNILPYWVIFDNGDAAYFDEDELAPVDVTVIDGVASNTLPANAFVLSEEEIAALEWAECAADSAASHTNDDEGYTKLMGHANTLRSLLTRGGANRDA